MLRYISIFREKYNRHSILFTGFGYKLVTDQTTYNFIHGISIIEQHQLFSLELNYIYYYVNSLVIQSFLSRHVRRREAYCYYPSFGYLLFGGHHRSNEMSRRSFTRL